jgi:hypothetical protein
MNKIFTTLSIFSILLFGNNVSAQGETCATAITASIGTYTSDGPTSGNGTSTNDGTHSDWYAFTPSASGDYTISSCNSNGDTYVLVHSGSCASLTLVSQNDDACGLQSIVDVTLTGGQTYWIEWVDIFSSQPVEFSISVTVSLDEESMNNLAIYPNPTTDGIFTVDFVGASNADVKVINSLGSVVYNAETSSMSTVDISQQPAGLYFVVVNSNGESATRKLIKK